MHSYLMYQTLNILFSVVVSTSPLDNNDLITLYVAYGNVILHINYLLLQALELTGSE